MIVRDNGTEWAHLERGVNIKSRRACAEMGRGSELLNRAGLAVLCGARDGACCLCILCVLKVEGIRLDDTAHEPRSLTSYRHGSCVAIV